MIIFRLLSVLLLVFLAPAAFADTQGALHTKSAFLLAQRGLWSAAIAEAKAAHSPVLVKYFTWEYLKDPGSDADFETITGFMETNPDWPDQKALERHAEVALLTSDPSDATLSEWFTAHPAQTNIAKLKTAHDPQALRALIRESWITGDYDKATEKKLLEKYHDTLRAEDHIHRIDRLLWEGKDDDAKRLIKIVPYNYQRLFQARLALAENKQVAPVDIVNVPPNLKSDPGLIYERIRWRMHLGDREGVRELLLLAPAEVPYPEKWWPLRERQIREAVSENNIPLAEKLLAHDGQKEGTLPYKEAEWLRGWIELEFLHEPGKAYGIFSKLFEGAHTPGGKARIAYWAGRAAEKTSRQIAARCFAQAAAYPTTFYGQLAAWELNKDARINITSAAEPTAGEKARFKKRELVQLVYALAEAHETDSAGRFILYLNENAKSPEESLMAVELGRNIKRIDFSVRAAKKALQNDIVALDSGWPVIKVPSNAEPEKPLLLALMRQESEFYADAISSSNAYGLMQLLPQTAKELAKKHHLSFKADRLFDPDYNMTIGSLYLSKMLEQFDGSYVLSVASYNAGPARVRQWMDEMGAPTRNVRETVDWIEKIPTNETRNYVEHVLENTEVYRFVTAGKKPVRLKIAEDLTR